MKEFAIENLSSLSGLAHFKNLIFTVSDEFFSVVVTDLKSQYEFEFDVLKNKTLRSLSFAERKKHKPDLESLSVVSINNKSFLHLMPSLSKENRCYGYLIELNDQAKVPSADLFIKVLELNYESLLQELKLAKCEINIEGHLFHESKLLLFNRGHVSSPSQILVFDYNFNTYQAKLKQIESVDLGAYEGYAIHWTDVCWKSVDSIYFCASVEKVDNAFDDGEVLASFIGEYHLETKKCASLKKIVNSEKIEGLSLINEEFVFCVDPDKEGKCGKIFYGFKL